MIKISDSTVYLYMKVKHWTTSVAILIEPDTDKRNNYPKVVTSPKESKQDLIAISASHRSVALD